VPVLDLGICLTSCLPSAIFTWLLHKQVSSSIISQYSLYIDTIEIF